MRGRLLLFFLSIAIACARPGGPGPGRPKPPPGPPRVILVVADGAGLAYWNAARLFSDSVATLSFPVVGLMGTGNTSSPMPESASSATAVATGVLTHAGAVGVGPDSLPIRTVLEAAEEAGLATGLVTTTNLVDATPAAFASHVPNRRQAFEIARQIVEADAEVLLGDGRRFFEKAFRPDSADLLGRIRDRYVFVETPEDLAHAREAGVERLAGFFDIDSLRAPSERRPSLPEMTDAALAVVARDPDGFFLVVESEHTDHQGHENAPLDVIAAEMLEVDRAVRQALEHRARVPGVLIVVLGDHETGGLAIVRDPGTREWRAAWATAGHTPGMVPLFATGPGAERFGGVRTNAEVGRILLDIVAGADR